ncbi:MAG: PD-(D/E)XK nuclease family protein [Armatimonadetes bacterium]|nr:PD-(D/E)XK nuclease family protein [Armatimonadota bacterium]
MNDNEPLTASLIEAFVLCPMKYRLYRLGGPQGGMTRRVDAARALHAAVKHCLDECYRAGGLREWPVERLHEEFARSFNGAACADSREEEECRATGLRLLAEYGADHVADEATDVRVDLTVEGRLGDPAWRANADRRETRADGSVAYVLYSTARQPPSPGSLSEDLRTGVLQLLAEQLEGRPVEVEIHALRKRRIIDATKRPDELTAIEERATQLAASARSLVDPPALKGRHCRWCHVRSVCPKWAK